MTPLENWRRTAKHVLGVDQDEVELWLFEVDDERGRPVAAGALQFLVGTGPCAVSAFIDIALRDALGGEHTGVVNARVVDACTPAEFDTITAPVLARDGDVYVFDATSEAQDHQAVIVGAVRLAAGAGPDLPAEAMRHWFEHIVTDDALTLTLAPITGGRRAAASPPDVLEGPFHEVAAILVPADPARPCTRLALPADYWLDELGRHLGGIPVRAQYDRDLLLWSEDNAANEQPANPRATTYAFGHSEAAARNGLSPDAQPEYWLYGDIVVTGPDDADTPQDVPARAGAFFPTP